MNIHRERESAAREERTSGVPSHGVDRPDVHRGDRSEARASRVPKISGNQSWIAIETHGTREARTEYEGLFLGEERSHVEVTTSGDISVREWRVYS